MSKEAEKPFDIFGELGKVSKLGYVEGEVKIGEEMKLTLSTITASEEAEVFNNCVGYDGLAFLTRNKIETIIYAIKAVNGNKFLYMTIEDELKKIEAKEETLRMIRRIVNSWDREVISYVYAEYLDIAQKGEEELHKMGIQRKQDVENELARIANEKKEAEEAKKEE